MSTEEAWLAEAFKPPAYPQSSLISSWSSLTSLLGTQHGILPSRPSSISAIPVMVASQCSYEIVRKIKEGRYMIRIWNILKIVLQSSFSYTQPSTTLDFSIVSAPFLLMIQFIFHLFSGWEFDLIHSDCLCPLLVFWGIFQSEQYRFRWEMYIYRPPPLSLTELGRRETHDLGQTC